MARDEKVNLRHTEAVIAKNNQRLVNKRNRIKWTYRCIEAGKLQNNTMYKLMLILLFIAIFTALWMGKDAATEFMPDTTLSMEAFRNIAEVEVNELPDLHLHTIVNFMLAGIWCILLVITFLFGLLPLMGTPKDARDRELEIAGCLKLKESEWHKRPFIISIREIAGTNITEYVIFTRWLSSKWWQDPNIEADILTALDGVRIEDYRYGYKGIIKRRLTKHIVILPVADGVEPPRREGLADDEV